jgi:hypothetical protein
VRISKLGVFGFFVAIATLLVLPAARETHAQGAPARHIEVSFPESLSRTPLTGRLFLMIGRKSEPELRLQSYWFNSTQFIGVDVAEWKPGTPIVIDERSVGYPFRGLNEMPAGDYNVQASLIVYQAYRRADGHTVYAPDAWEGQHFHASPGNLYSDMQRIRLDPTQSAVMTLTLTHRVPTGVPGPADTEWVKHVRIQSKLLSRFWGRPIYIGAVVLLPRDYDSRSEVRYPVIYQQQAHFNHRAPFDFSVEDSPAVRSLHAQECRGKCESGFEFSQTWRSDGFPRFVAVALQHPTPYADFSSAINSANNGPYGDAIVTELIPYIEKQFRIAREPCARAIVGKSLGGRDALAQQLHYPEVFGGGAWIFYPWGIDFSNYGSLDIYERENAFEIRKPEGAVWKGFWAGGEWVPLERYMGRIADGTPLVTFRQLSDHDTLIDPRWGGEFGAEDANFGPVGASGYPEPLWDRSTGAINVQVASHWREQGDLAAYAERHWTKIGPLLRGKLHFYVGEMDEYYRQRGVRHFDERLRTLDPASGATFEYGPLDGHGWQPMSNAELIRTIAAQVARDAPPGGCGISPAVRQR